MVYGAGRTANELSLVGAGVRGVNVGNIVVTVAPPFPLEEDFLLLLSDLELFFGFGGQLSGHCCGDSSKQPQGGKENACYFIGDNHGDLCRNVKSKRGMKMK